MRGPLMLLPLLLAGCSCQPDPPDAAAAGQEAPRVGRSTPVSADTPERRAEAPAPDPSVGAVAAAAMRPSEVVRGYVISLLHDDRRASDAYWLHAPAPTAAGDGALRALRDVRTLRVATGRPVARNGGEPATLIEVPVTVRVVTDAGHLRYSGWYRLVPDPERQQWKLHAASVQPVLD